MKMRNHFLKALGISAASLALGLFLAARASATAMTVEWDKTFDSGANDMADQIGIDATNNVHVLGHDGNGQNRKTVFGPDGTVLVGGMLFDTSDALSAGTRQGPKMNEQGTVFYYGDVDTGTIISNCGWGTGSTTYTYETDMVVIKHNQNGTVAARMVDSNPNHNDVVQDFALDSSGNVYVLGTSSTPISSSASGCGWGTTTNYGTAEVRVVKFDSGGVRVWAITTTLYQNGGNLAVDGAGSVYVLGSSGCPTCGDVRFAKLDGGTGAVVGSMYCKIDPSFNFVDFAVADRVGNKGAVMVFYNTKTGKRDYRIACFTPDMTATKWEVSTGTTYIDAMSGVDKDGNVMVMGHVSNVASTIWGGTDNVVWMKKLSGVDGSLSFAQKTLAPTTGMESITGGDIDGAGNVYLVVMTTTCTGDRYGQPCSKKFRVIKYEWATTGAETWTVTDSNGQMINSPGGFALGSNGRMYVGATTASCTSYAANSDICSDIRMIKYTDNPDATKPSLLPTGKKSQLTLPDNGAVIPSKGQDAVISLRTASAGKIETAVYTASGKKVRKSLATEASGPDTLLRWDGKDDDGKEVVSGVYLLRVKATGVEKVYKIVIVR